MSQQESDHIFNPINHSTLNNNLRLPQFRNQQPRTSDHCNSFKRDRIFVDDSSQICYNGTQVWWWPPSHWQVNWRNMENEANNNNNAPHTYIPQTHTHTQTYVDTQVVKLSLETLAARALFSSEKGHNHHAYYYQCSQVYHTHVVCLMGKVKGHIGRLACHSTLLFLLFLFLLSFRSIRCPPSSLVHSMPMPPKPSLAFKLHGQRTALTYQVVLCTLPCPCPFMSRCHPSIHACMCVCVSTMRMVMAPWFGICGVCVNSFIVDGKSERGVQQKNSPTRLRADSFQFDITKRIQGLCFFFHSHIILRQALHIL